MSKTKATARRTARVTKFPSFSAETATHASTFLLRNGAKLTIAKCPTGWFIKGYRRGFAAKIALTNDAFECVLSAGIHYRDHSRPLPFIHLREINRAALSAVDPTLVKGKHK